MQTERRNNIRIICSKMGLKGTSIIYGRLYLISLRVILILITLTKSAHTIELS